MTPLRVTEPINPLACLVALSLLACGSELEGAAPRVDADAEVGDVPDTSDAPDTSDDIEPDTAADTGDTAGDVDTSPDTEVVVPADWQVESLGDVGVIEDLTLASATLGFASSGPRVLRWDGRTWMAYGEPGFDPEGSRAVHGVATDGVTVAAVGEGGLVAVRPVSGGAWTELMGGPTVALRAAAIRGDRLFVAGDQGTVASIELAPDAAWTSHFTSSTINLHALWADPNGSDDEAVYAVGTGGQLVRRDGLTWRATQIAGSTVRLLDIIGLSDGTLVAVGNEHTVTAKRPTDAAWRGQATNDDRRRDLAGLALSRDGTLRAFGASGAVLRQEGTSWSVETSAGVAAGLKNFRAAAAVPGSSSVVALAAEGGGVRFDGTTWQSLATSPESTVNDLAGVADDLWAVGNRGVLARRLDGAWSGVPVNAAGDLNAVAVATQGGVRVAWAVGDAGLIVKVVEGAVTVVPAPVPLDLFGVAASADRVVACGRGGTLLSIDPDTDAVTVRLSGTTADLKAASFGGDGAVWLAGSFGTLLRWQGDALAPLPILSGVGGSLNALAPTGDGVLAVGDNGVVIRATQAGAELENEEPGRFLYAVATSPSARDAIAIAVGSGGRILRQDAAGWVTDVPAERAATFEAAWIDATGHALIGGIYRVHHLESRLEPLGTP